MTFHVGSFIGGVITGVILVIGYILYVIQDGEDVEDDEDWQE